MEEMLHASVWPSLNVRLAWPQQEIQLLVERDFKTIENAEAKIRESCLQNGHQKEADTICSVGHFLSSQKRRIFSNGSFKW